VEPSSSGIEIVIPSEGRIAATVEGSAGRIGEKNRSLHSRLSALGRDDVHVCPLRPPLSSLPVSPWWGWGMPQPTKEEVSC
jgi:hypothetical protein